MGCVPPEWGLLRLSRGGRAWEQPRPEPAGPFWNPRKAMWPRESVRVRAPGRDVLTSLSPSVSAVTPHGFKWQLLPLSGEQSARSLDTKEALMLGVPGPPRSSAPRQQSAGLLSEWPLLELNGSDEARPLWPGSRDTGEAGGAGARSWTRDSQAVHVLAPPLTSCVTLGSSFPAQPWLLIWEMRIIPPTASWCFRN